MASSMRDAIREKTRLARMRQGQDVGEPTDIPSLQDPENGEMVRVMVVPLMESESQQGLMRAAFLEVPDNAAGIQARNRAAMESDVWHAVREPGDISKKVFASIEDMVETLAPTDIDYLFDALALVMDYASPSIDGLTDKDLDELKKAFGEMDWSGLTGRRWAAVRLTLLILFPELLQGKLRGFTSTDSATATNANGASI